MLDRRTVFEVHRLRNQGWSKKKIATTLHLSPKTVRKYLHDPNPERISIKRASKLDPFQEEIERLLNIDPTASSSVILQRIAPQGFERGITILKDYLHRIPGYFKKKEAFIRFEFLPGEQCQVDWGHFGSMAYGEAKRKLYCLAILECHSRLLYLEFTHSQRQETLHRCLLHAFHFFQGTPKELVTDNKVLDQWIRRRLRKLLWRQWKKPKTRYKKMLKLGLKAERAKKAAAGGRGPWYIAGASRMHAAVPNRRLREWGLQSLLQWHRQSLFSRS